jgi:hypothetical protein
MTASAARARNPDRTLATDEARGLNGQDGGLTVGGVKG